MLPKGCKPGNRIKLTLQDTTVSGVLLPRSTLYDEEHVVIKLDSGYNVGIHQKHIVSAKVLSADSLPTTPTPSISTQKKLPKIGVVSAGGTIVSRLDYATGGVKWLSDPTHVLALNPAVAGLAQFDPITSPVRKDSGEIESSDWQKIAQDVHTMLLDDTLCGVLIFIGTDTLHYSAAALSFMLRHVNKPVVFTYSQRSTDRASTDGVMNVEAAVRFALTKTPGVYVVGHAQSDDTYCHVLRGTTMRKMHTSRRDAFRPINDLPVAHISNTDITFLQKISPHNGREPLLNDQYDTRIAFIHYMPDMSPDILEYYRKQGYTGAVISLLGLGQIAGSSASNNWIPAIEKAIKHGMIICAVPQAIYGALQPSVYATGRLLQHTGVVYLENMLAETAYVKLGCALGRWTNRRQVEKFMTTNIAGELQPFLRYDTFLR